jgi:tetratricopeptide (TPR) repeat protein
MLRLFLRFLALGLIVCLVLYVVVLNREPATLRLGEAWQISAASGFIYIGVFAVGVLLSLLVGVLFGALMYWRERRLIALEKRRQSFEQMILKARSYLASDEWQKARDLWQQILRKDPDNIVARVELSRSFQGSGDLQESLRVLDLTRATFKENGEVLFRAVELNLALGNQTAALDNLGLLLRAQPNHKAAAMARDIALRLGKLDDAFEYQQQVESLGFSGEDYSAIRADLAFRRGVQDAGGDNGRLVEFLVSFTKKHPQHSGASEKLASLWLEEGRVENAADLLAKSAKTSQGVEGWSRLASLWLKQLASSPLQRAERALAAARSAVAGSRGIERIRAELLVARVQLELGQLDECKATLENLQTIRSKEGMSLPTDLERDALVLAALTAHRLRDAQCVDTTLSRLIFCESNSMQDGTIKSSHRYAV